MLTPPGSNVTIGREVNVPTSTRYGSAVVGVTVRSLSEADPASARVLGPSLRGSTAWFIKVALSNLTGSKLSRYRPRVYGLLDDDSQASPAQVVGTLPSCPTLGTPSSFDAQGSRWTGCVVAVVPPGRRIVGAYYTDVVEGFTGYYKDPVTWSLPTGSASR